MKKNIIVMVIFFTMLFISGCSSKYPVTFDSNPKGASLICNGTNWGYTPKTLYYDKKVKKMTTLNVSSCSANWVSGARKNYGTVPPTQYPNGVRTTIQRPRGDGYSTDAEFALKVQNMNYQRRQAQAQEDAASSASYNNYLNQQRNNKLQQQNNQLNNINNYMRYGY
jgi:hypothetical protein